MDASRRQWQSPWLLSMTKKAGQKPAFYKVMNVSG